LVSKTERIKEIAKEKYLTEEHGIFREGTYV